MGLISEIRKKSKLSKCPKIELTSIDVAKLNDGESVIKSVTEHYLLRKRVGIISMHTSEDLEIEEVIILIKGE